MRMKLGEPGQAVGAGSGLALTAVTVTVWGGWAPTQRGLLWERPSLSK